MAVLPRGRGARPAPAQKEPKPAPAPKQEPRSLISESTYNNQEPTEMRGATDSGYSSMTSGRHHGAIMALADAVGHHAASITEGGMSSSHQQGMAELERTYDHLAAHAESHKAGKHSEAAGHLKEATKGLNNAVTRLGGTRGTITNRFGETVQGRNIAPTTNDLVNHYASVHNTRVGSVSRPEKYDGVPTKKAEERLEQKKAAEKYMQPRGKAPTTRSEVVHFTGGDRRVKGDN